MKTINEYFLHDEKISLISEYLLSKTHKNIKYIKYYLVKPDDILIYNFTKHVNLTEDEKIYQYNSKNEEIEFWLLSTDKVINMIKYFKGISLNDRYTNIWEVPKDYEIKDFKNDFIKGKINPSNDLKEIKNISKINEIN